MDVARCEIRNRLQRWDEMDITLLFGIKFGRMRSRWKGKFVHFAMEQYFSTGSVLEIYFSTGSVLEIYFSIGSVLEIERKIREDEVAMGQRGIEGGDDDVKQ